MKKASIPSDFVSWFRHSSPYIHAFRGRTFVIAFGGEAVSSPSFAGLIHDIALLNALGIRLVLVHGARPQIEQRLQQQQIQPEYVGDTRITDARAMDCVKDAAGSVRVEVEALLSMGLANSPMAGARIRVASGNFVTARPLGVRDGVDFQHSGEVRRVDSEGIRQRLDDGAIVLLSPLGYSPTGEVFNVNAREIATATAIALHADKLLFLTDQQGLRNGRKQLIRQLNPTEARQLLQSRKKLAREYALDLQCAIDACSGHVRRVHLIDRHVNGGLLLELFTRDGIGTLITSETYEGTRRATIEDVGGILELISPLEADGVLVKRSREQLELEISHFHVVERDGAIIACAALYPMGKQYAELACLAVDAEYRKQGRGDTLLEYMEKQAQAMRIAKLFVLTTQTTHWFRERGFSNADIKALPVKRRALYNYQRNSRVMVKTLD